MNQTARKKIKKFLKFFRVFIYAIIGLYTLAVIISAILMSQIQQITYNALAFGVTIRTNIVDFQTNIAQQDINNFDGELKEHKENSISEERSFKIKTICALSLLPLWLKNYHNPFVLDGDYYNIVRSYKNSSIVTYGSNAYPLGYDFVLNAILGAIE
ncbi:MAG: hypothetical protein FWF44_05425 [Defluviitaleaceae bacterium]|nr:hypothetical protein [Defluviitaleaceae bacterium]